MTDIIKLVFEGHSDDTFGETNHFHDDYDNCASGWPIEYLVSAGDYAIVVTGQYCPENSGSWMIGVANHDPNHNDADFPNWPIRIEPQNYRNGFQPQLVIEAPSDVKICCLQRENNDE